MKMTRRTSCQRTLLTAAALLLTATTSQAATFRVGAGLPCDHSDIQDAVNEAALSAGPHFILIANNQIYLDQEIVVGYFSGSEIQLTLVGGFADCLDPLGSAAAPTIIDGSLAEPTLHIEAASNVLIARLDIKGSGQFGVQVDSMAQAAFEQVRIRNNAGGLLVTGGTAEVYASLIYSNVNPGLGGGISCSNSTLRLADVEIFDNSANYGGGASLRSGCNASFGNTVTVRNNLAVFNGGGLELIDSSVGDLGRGAGTATGSTVIRDNQALWDGGGLALDGFSAYNVANTRVTNNTAHGQGGGAYVEGASILRLARSATCKTKPCTEISGNRLTTELFGSAVHATGNSEVYLFGGRMESNRNTAGTAYPFYTTGSFAWLEGVEIWGNTGPAVFLADVSDLTLAFISAARNFTSTGANALLVASGGSSTAIHSSAFQDIAGFLALVSGTITGHCIYSNSLTGLTSGAEAGVGDPQFLDPAAGDLRLRPTSPAVDFCDTSFYSPLFPDVHGEPRGYDHEDNTNGLPGIPTGTYDLGADEVWWFFADGFESGDVSSWTASTP
jgi:hypothetical protein